MPPPSKNKSRKRQQVTKDFQTKEPSSRNATQDSSHSLPFELQQIILNTFATAFPLTEDVISLKQTIQEVKGHLFNRDFSAAFGQDTYLQAYAIRWSAARALGYTHILARINREYLNDDFGNPSSPNAPDASNPSTTNPDIAFQRPTDQPTRCIFCVGGGAGAELLALASCQRFSKSSTLLEVIAIDSANWDNPLKQLCSALASPPRLTAHTSETARAKPENRALLENPSKVSTTFLHQDVLSWDDEHMRTTLSLQNISLCTIMFTLNELFSASLPKTTSFLLTLTEFLLPGNLLLVVDSPGSYSEIRLGKQQQQGNNDNDNNVDKCDDATSNVVKRYPMKWLLDHTLLDVAGKNNDAKWEKVESEDSLWFRIAQKEKLRYPVELENMRYQLHLYRHL